MAGYCAEQEAFLLGLDDPADQFQRKVDALNAFIAIRKILERNQSLLKTFTKRQYMQRKQSHRFRDNVQKLAEGSDESRVFLPLINGSVSQSNDSINRYLLGLWTLKNSEFERIKEHGLARAVSEVPKNIDPLRSHSTDVREYP